LKDRLFN